jgi:hypothetical protein
MPNRPMPPNVGSAGTANTYASLQANDKAQYPTPSQRKKRFAKIREKIQGKR